MHRIGTHSRYNSVLKLKEKKNEKTAKVVTTVSLHRGQCTSALLTFKIILFVIPNEAVLEALQRNLLDKSGIEHCLIDNFMMPHMLEDLKLLKPFSTESVAAIGYDFCSI